MDIQASIRMSAADFDEFVRRPENADKLLELIGGKVVEVVSNPFSSNLAARVATFIGMYLLDNDIGFITGADAVVWRINPPEEQAAVFAPGQPVRLLTVNDILDGGDLLPGFKLAVRDIFSRRKN